MNSRVRPLLYGGISQIVCEASDLEDVVTAFRVSEARPIGLLLRGTRMAVRESVFQEFAAALQFPFYFGENWNAFNECVADLDWLPDGEIKLWIVDAETVLIDGDPDEFDVLLRSLSRAAAEFSEATSFRPVRKFHTILHTSPKHEIDLQSRLMAIGQRQ